MTSGYRKRPISRPGARAENLSILSETLGLELEAQERAVGPFRADILCKDSGSDRWVLIENQLERTDHSHLGQLLTYACGLEAVTIVWIAARFTEEHRSTLDWLNRSPTRAFASSGWRWSCGASGPLPYGSFAFVRPIVPLAQCAKCRVYHPGASLKESMKILANPSFAIFFGSDAGIPANVQLVEWHNVRFQPAADDIRPEVSLINTLGQISNRFLGGNVSVCIHGD